MSFGAIAADYDRLRPSPPQEAVSWLVPAGCQIAVDVGAGTGLLTRALARTVAHVFAVEPDERMRAVLHARSPDVTVLAGTGEEIPMPDASADGVFVSSAWHWMDPDRAAGEIGRVLRDGGRFGVIWTSRDRQVGWVRELDSLREPDQRSAAAADEAAPADEAADTTRPRQREVTLPQTGLFGNIETASFSFSRPMTIDALIDMLATYSGLITASPQSRAAGLARARAVIQERFPDDGEIDVPMRAWCWRADRTRRAVPAAF